MTSPDAVGDELAIRSLLARFSMATDIGTPEEYLAVLTDDVVIELPGAAPREGLEAARRGVEATRASGLLGPGSRTLHHLGGSIVSIDGDAAESITTYVFLRLGDDAAAPIAGRYYDTLRRTPDGWRLAHRRIVST